MSAIPQIGDIILDRYLIEAVIDKKQETAIYKCMDTRLDVPGVLKYLIHVGSPSYAASLKERFIEGARVQARLNHPNIVHVTNIESRGDVTFSVMELLYGDTLETHISRYQVNFSVKEVLELFIAIADALAMAHEMGVVHKYLNPSNIILNQQGNRLTPRILNFSAMKVPELLHPFTALPYLSPEQFDPEATACPQSDVFSIGAMLYFVFMKHPPFIGESFEKYVQYYQRYETLSALPPEIAAPLVPIIQRALSRDINRRFASASQLLHELKSLAPRNSLSPNLSIEVPKAQTGSGPRYPTNPSQVLSSTGSTQTASAGSNPSQVAIRRVTNPSQPVLSEMGSNPSAQAHPQSGSNPAQAIPQRSSQPEIPAPPPKPSQLPPALSSLYEIQHQIAQNKDSCLAIVKEKGKQTSQTLCLKFLQNASPTRKSAFLKAIEQQRQLALKTPYIQAPYLIHPEAHAYVAYNEPRQSLASYAKTSGALDPLFVMQSFTLLAEAMQLSHEQNIVHAGIQPHNVFLIQRNNIFYPVIFDSSQRLCQTTKEQLLPSHIPYIAPELSWDLAKSNEQSDIYAFGMLMNFAILARSPYEHISEANLIDAIQTQQTAPSLSTLEPDVNPNFIKVIDWCTALNPNERYRHFADLRRDLITVIQPYA